VKDEESPRGEEGHQMIVARLLARSPSLVDAIDCEQRTALDLAAKGVMTASWHRSSPGKIDGDSQRYGIASRAENGHNGIAAQLLAHNSTIWRPSTAVVRFWHSPTTPPQEQTSAGQRCIMLGVVKFS